MPNTIVRWGEEGDQTEPVDAKKDAGAKAQKPEAAEYINWLWSRFGAGVSLDRDENALLRLPLISSSAFKRGVGSATFARAGTATYIDRYGVLRTAVVDEPRFGKNNYITEGDSENLLFRSDDFNNAYWTKTQSSITPNDTTAPDGVAASADLFVENSNLALHTVNRNVAASDATVLNSLSAFAKANVRTQLQLRMDSGGDAGVLAVFDLSSGVVLLTDAPGDGSDVSAKITPLADGWYRCELTGIPSAGGTTVTTEIGSALDGAGNYQGTGADSLWIWGAQCEELNGSTSYIATLAAAVTRSRDFLSVTFDNNIPHADDDCSLFIDLIAVAFIDNARLLEVTGTSNRIINIGSAGAPRIGVLWDAAESPNTSIISANTLYRVGIRFIAATSELSIWLDGRKEQALTRSASTGEVPTGISIGQTGIGNREWFGNISNIRIYNRAFSDEEMSVA